MLILHKRVVGNRERQCLAHRHRQLVKGENFSQAGSQPQSPRSQTLRSKHNWMVFMLVLLMKSLPLVGQLQITLRFQLK